MTASDAKVGSVYQPASRLNIFIVDPVDEATDSDGNKFNNLGLSLQSLNLDYYNTDLVNSLLPSLNRNADYFNLLMTKRRNTFGFRAAPSTGPALPAVLHKHHVDNTFTYVNSPIQRVTTYKPISSQNSNTSVNLIVRNYDRS